MLRLHYLTLMGTGAMPAPPFALYLECERGCNPARPMSPVSLQFLSYGLPTATRADRTAVDGPAMGHTPADIGILETNYDLYGRTSISLIGEGNIYSDFHWQENHDEDTRGSLNIGQSLGWVYHHGAHAAPVVTPVVIPPAPPPPPPHVNPPPPPPPPPPPAPPEVVPDVPTSRPPSTCFGKPAEPGDRRADPSRLRLGTFNTGGLFDGIGDGADSVWNGGTSCPGYDPPTLLCDAAGATEHLRRLRAVLLNLRADILNINNVEDCAILQTLVSGQGRNRHGVQAYEAYMEAFTQTDELPVGLITQLDPIADLTRNHTEVHYPMDNSQCGMACVPEQSNGFCTAPAHYYRTEFALWGMRIALFGLNLPGPPGDPSSCSRREAQAAIVRERVRMDVSAGREVIVLGDLNDFDRSNPDQNGNLPRSRVLETLQDLGGDGSNDLLNVVSLMDATERYSEWHDLVGVDGTANGHDDGAREHSQMDHILLTPRLFAHVGVVYIDHSSDASQVAGHWPLMVELRESIGVPGANADNTKATWSNEGKSTLEFEIILSIAVSIACAAGIWRAAAKQRKAAMMFFGFDFKDDTPSSVAMDAGIRRQAMDATTTSTSANPTFSTANPVQQFSTGQSRHAPPQPKTPATYVLPELDGAI